MVTSLYKRKTLKGRVREIIDFGRRDPLFMKTIARTAEIDRSNIEKYVFETQQMKLFNVGKMLDAAKKHFQKHLSDDPANMIWEQLDLKNISERLTNVGYKRLGVYGALHLQNMLSRDLDVRTLPPVNFEAYLHENIVRDWEENPDFNPGVYIPLTATHHSNSALEVDSFLKDWSYKGKEHILFLLGDLGTGKTTVFRHFAYSLAKEYLEDNRKRIPVFIPLDRFQQDRSSLENILVGYFENELHVY